MSNDYSKLTQRFWSKVQKGDECWEWQASGDRWGYGQIKHQGVMRLAHRVSWEMHHGAIPEGMQVCHRCDNRKCVRPDHLFLGTQRENVKDMHAKGRQGVSQGQRLSKANEKRRMEGVKLTVESVRGIRADKARGDTVAAISEKYGVNHMTIWKVTTGRTWKHVH